MGLHCSWLQCDGVNLRLAFSDFELTSFGAEEEYKNIFGAEVFDS